MTTSGLGPLLDEMRALLEGTPSSATAKAALPAAVLWLLVRLRTDAKARRALIDGVEGLMARLLAQSAAPTSVPGAPMSKGKKGRGATPPPAVAMVPPVKDARELFDRAIEELDKNTTSLVADAIDTMAYETPFESWLISILNGEIHSASGLGPWSCQTDVGGGELTVRMRLAGEEQDEDTAHPGQTDDAEIAQVFKHTLGADSARFDWSMDRTPRSWEFSTGGRYILNYNGHAEFKYRDGQAALFALGAKELLACATRALANA